MSNIKRKLFLILLGGFFLRLVFVIIFDIGISGDSESYFRFALSLAKGNGFGEIDAGPLYPLLITPFILFFGSWWAICMKLLNVLLSTAILLIIYKLGKELFDSKTGLISACIFAVFPYSIFWTSYITPDILLSFLVLLSLLFYTKFQNSKKLSHIIWGSIILALSVHVKPLTLSTPIFLLLWLWLLLRNVKLTLKYLCIIVAVMLVITIPWNIRQYYYYGKFTLIPIHFADNFAWGNNPHYLEREKNKDDLADWYKSYQTDRNNDYYIARKNLLNKTIENITSNPRYFLKTTFHKFLKFWRLYPHGPPYNSPFYVTIALLQNLPMIIFGAFGVFYFLKRNMTKYSLPVLIAINFTVVHSLIVAHARYRLPIEPIILLFGIGFIFSYIDMWKGQLK